MAKSKPKGICKNCKSYQPNEKLPGFAAGKCAKGVDLIAISSIFDVKETHSCKKWSENAKKTT